MKRSISSIPVTPDKRYQSAGSARARKRSSGHRLSGVSAGRPSLLSILTGRPSYQESRGTESKQQSDRSALSTKLNLIITFLTENNYPYPLNRLQSSPPAKDVVSIFEFIVSMIFPEFKPPKKFEDAFTMVLSMLRYPHTVSKRHLQPVGSIRNWPTIVAGFAWLTNLVKTNMDLRRNCGIQMGSMEQPSKLDVIIQFQVNPFKEYVMGTDDHDALDEEFTENLPNVMGLEELKYINEMSAELKKREMGLAEIDAQCDNMQDKLVNKLADKEKMVTFIEELEAYIVCVDETKVNLEKDFTQLHEQYTALNAEIQCKERVVATQKVTVEDVKHLQSTLAEADNEQSRLGKKISLLNEQISGEEAIISDLGSKVQALIDQYNKLAGGCQLIPAAAENAQCFDYEIESSIMDSENSPHVSEVENRLDIILKQLKTKGREMNSGEMELISALDKFKETIFSLKGDIADIETNIRCKDKSFDLLKQEKSQELQMMQMEIDHVEKEIFELECQLKVSLDFQQVHSEGQEQKIRIEELQNAIDVKRKDLDNFLQLQFNKARQQIDRVQGRISQLSAFVLLMKDNFLNLTTYKPTLNINMLKAQLEEVFSVLGNLETNFELKNIS